MKWLTCRRRVGSGRTAPAAGPLWLASETWHEITLTRVRGGSAIKTAGCPSKRPSALHLPWKRQSRHRTNASTFLCVESESHLAPAKDRAEFWYQQKLSRNLQVLLKRSLLPSALRGVRGSALAHFSSNCWWHVVNVIHRRHHFISV